MENLFKVISVSSLLKIETTGRSIREVVLKSYCPRMGQSGGYVGFNAFVCTLFGDDAERWNIAEGSYVAAELTFSVQESTNGRHFQSVRLGRCCLMTESDWAKGIERQQQSSQPEPETF